MNDGTNVPNNAPNVPNAQPGKGKAIAGLVLGILAVSSTWIPFIGILGLVMGIVGLVLAAGAKKDGLVGGLQTAAFVLALIGVILGGILFFACSIPAACLVCTAASTGIW